MPRSVSGRFARAGPRLRHEPRRHDRAQHGDAERTAQLPGGVVHGRADAGLAQRDRRHDQRGERRHGDGHAQGQRDDGGVDRPDRAVDLHLREDRQAEGGGAEAERHDPVGTEAGDQLRHLRGDRHDHRGHRQLEQTGLERRVAEHQLEVLGDQEEGAEHGEEGQRHPGRGHAEPPVAEQAQVEHRVAGPQLPGREQPEGEEGQAEGGERRGRRPPLVGALDDGVHEGAQADDRQAGADQVERLLLRVLRPRDEPGAEHEGGDDHRHVDEEDRAPPEVLEQPAGGDGADGRATAGDAGPDRDGLRPFVGGEDVGEDRQRRRHDEGGGDTHDRPGDDHRGRRVGEAGHHRADEEQGEAGLEGALAAEAVAEGPGGEEEAGEDERVGVDHPLELAGRGVEVAGQGGDGDVEAGVADDDDQQAGAEHGQDRPPPFEHVRVDPVVAWCGWWCCCGGRHARPVLRLVRSARVFRYECVSEP